MKSRTHDPRRLDVAAAAADGVTLSGAIALGKLARLSEGLSSDAAASWSAHFERRGRQAADPEIWLQLRAAARVPRQCQRCLQTVLLDLGVDRAFQFVRDEATAEAMDAEAEHDVLALSWPFDLLTLVEDELLLELPLVPRHDKCPNPLPMPSDAEGAEAPANPFASLAVLKRGPQH